jgi:hypothetical protein
MLLKSQLFFQTVLLVVLGNTEHEAERQKIGNKLREGFLTVSLKDLLVLPRLLKREFGKFNRN